MSAKIDGGLLGTWWEVRKEWAYTIEPESTVRIIGIGLGLYVLDSDGDCQLTIWFTQGRVGPTGGLKAGTFFERFTKYIYKKCPECKDTILQYDDQVNAFYCKRCQGHYDPEQLKKGEK